MEFHVYEGSLVNTVAAFITNILLTNLQTHKKICPHVQLPVIVLRVAVEIWTLLWWNLKWPLQSSMKQVRKWLTLHMHLECLMWLFFSTFGIDRSKLRLTNRLLEPSLFVSIGAALYHHIDKHCIKCANRYDSTHLLCSLPWHCMVIILSSVIQWISGGCGLLYAPKETDYITYTEAVWKIPFVVAKVVLETSHSLAAGEFPSSPFYSVSTEPKSFTLKVQVLLCVALQTFMWTEG